MKPQAAIATITTFLPYFLGGPSGSSGTTGAGVAATGGGQGLSYALKPFIILASSHSRLLYNIYTQHRYLHRRAMPLVDARRHGAHLK